MARRYFVSPCGMGVSNRVRATLPPSPSVAAQSHRPAPKEKQNGAGACLYLARLALAVAKILQLLGGTHKPVRDAFLQGILREHSLT